MFVSHKDLNRRNLVNNFCLQVEEWKRHRLVEEEDRVGIPTAITAYEIPLVSVASFK